MKENRYEAPAIAATGLRKSYAGPGGGVTVLSGLDLTVSAGEVVVIRGRSGTGKTTLLNLLGLLDRPDAGELRLAGEDAVRPEGAALAALRDRVGHVFQGLHLLPRWNALENAAAGLMPLRSRDDERFGRARLLLSRLGLAGRLLHRPDQLSAGERQRVALARALIREPVLVLADEPAGSLDPDTAAETVALLVAETRAAGAALVLVAHHPLPGLGRHRRLVLSDGLLREEEPAVGR